MEIVPFGSHGSVQILWNSHSSIGKPNWIHHSNSAWKRIFFPKAWVSQAQKGSLLKRLKASERTADLTSNAASENSSQGPLEKKAVWRSTFPNGFEELILTVCDETSIAELSMKVGNFEMHLKRDIGISEALTSTISTIVSPTTAPPIPSEPMCVSTTAPAQQDVPKEPVLPETSPFSDIYSSKALKLAALGASSSNAYVLISSPSVWERFKLEEQSRERSNLQAVKRVT
ncbi:Biotin carboxyl carrier protein of acetyl-CoA [Musa troglodytarum]|uniref:Biotin carboxyl carrier protein of acetyl-CoA n=1 Tax=Musa troglodytarum TaxID=320322 RepID=A0A9E7H4L5_9LILI|nr:Biotin carboxyl carrier protein of acetyl-CoA [Musa troglodytarum]